MKFSVRQILASAIGAVCAAVVASVFGVKGTIVGVAIGSAAATTATALVAQSIERGHQAVKQAAVRVPESATLLRRLGGTETSGPSTSSVDEASAPTEVVGRSDPKGGSEAETVQMAVAAETERVELPATSTMGPATERIGVTTTPVPRAPVRSTTSPRFSWRTIAASAVVVFVLALLFITAIELISGKPLSTIFGGADTGTSLNNLVGPSQAPATTPTTTSTTAPTGTASTTTTTNGSTSTTSTTAPTGAASTTTTAPPPSSTTTTDPTLNATTTTTSSP